MDPLWTVESGGWEGEFPASVQEAAVEALEGGRVLFLPGLRFALDEVETRFLSPRTVRGAKNVSYDPATKDVGGAGVAGIKLHELRALLDRFARASQALVTRLLPAYQGGVVPGRASLRPVEVAGRRTSWRKDDTRLHVDSFPSMPTGGKRILRVFSNVNHEGRPRTWRIGGPFEGVAERFWPALRAPVWGSRVLLYAVGATKAMRTPYDSYMLQLHDRMKEDEGYQAGCRQVRSAFPPGSTWVAFTDQVPHAAMSGVHQLEQTFYVPVTSLRNERTAPLRVLEGLAGRKLA